MTATVGFPGLPQEGGTPRQVAAIINMILRRLKALAASGGGVADGDKGDVVVSGGGTIWTIDRTVLHPEIMRRVSLRF